MMRSLYSAVSGLKSHQQRMDVIGNNIANVNTPGFKKSRVSFEDMLYQTIRGAGRPVPGGRGGTNPMQIGPGVGIGSIDTIFDGNTLQDTGKNTDLGISGDGFFCVSDGHRTFYTRAGDFNFDQEGNLVSALNGMRVMGWSANNGVIDTNIAPGLINIPTQGVNISAHATTKAVYAGNLNFNDTTKTVRQTVFDSRGDEYTVTTAFTKATDVDNTWNWSSSVSQGDKVDPNAGNGIITFDSYGKYRSETGSISFKPDNGANQVTITPDFTGVTEFASDSSIVARNQDGYQAGSLESVTFDTTGTIVGVFSNGISQNLAQVALAGFTNPSGLQREGESLFSVSNNSGAPVLGTAGNSGYGSIKPGSLEASNVDLSSEFTDLIVTERGFQANSKVITTSDEMLQDLVNLKR